MPTSDEEPKKKVSRAPLIEAGKCWETDGGSNIFTALTLSFLTPLLRSGTESTIVQEDLGAPLESDRAANAYDAFKKSWARELARSTDKPPSVLRAQFGMVGKRNIARAIGFYFAAAGLSFVPIGALNVLVQHFSGTGYENLSIELLAGITAGLLVVPMIASICQAKHDVIMLHYGLRSRTAVTVAIYRHSLKLTAAARQGVSSGEVVNLFSNDAMRVEMLMKFMAMIFIAPIQVIVCLYLIYTQVGDAMFVGLAFMIFLVPIQGFVFGTLFMNQKKFLKLTDKRVNIMNEVLMGVRVLKYYSWEGAFEALVATMRAKEIRVLTKMAYIVAVGFSLVLLSAPIIQPVLIFAVYTKQAGEHMDAARAFTTIALFNLIRFPFAFLPMGIQQYLECKVSSARIGRFLARNTLDNYVEENTKVVPESKTTIAKVASPALLELEADERCVFAVREASFDWGEVDPLADPMLAKKQKTGKKQQQQQQQLVGKEAKGSLSGEEGNTDAEKAEEVGHVVKTTGMKPVKEMEMKAIAQDNDLTEISIDDPEASIDDAKESSLEEGGNSGAPMLILNDISIAVKSGDLVAVVGAVGSGKSSLLSALMGEMHLVRGCVARRGDCSVAYTSQMPWIINATLRENILFGKPMDDERYATVIKKCCLEADLEVLQAGDATEIGEKGINLSGGQKARVALARAAYANADVYLLDDPLSAVDAHVGKSLFEQCILGKDMLGNSTRLLVTHHVQYLQQCNHVLVLEHGRIAVQGTFEELLARKVPVILKVVEEAEETVSKQNMDGAAGMKKSASQVARSHSLSKDAEHLKAAGKNPSTKAAVKLGGVGKQSQVAKEARGKLISKEERGTGEVSLSAYTYYCRCGGWFWVVAALFTMFLGRGLEVWSAFWLAFWSKRAAAAEVRSEASEGLSDDRNSYFLTVYAILALGGVFGLTARALAIATHRLGASQTLHASLVASILRAPISFFDTTPIGRILNRFAADIQTIDIQISQSVSQLAGCVTNVCGALAAITGATRGTFLILCFPLIMLYYKIQYIFRRTSTEVERLAKISRSPIFSDFSQTLTGASSIRAYRSEDRFVLNAMHGMDRNNAAVIVVQLCFSWLSIRLDAIGACVLCFVVGLTVATKDFVPAGWLGLALAYAIELSMFLKHGVRMFAQTEGHMASVERVMTYTNDIDQEESEFLIEDQNEAASKAIEATKAAMEHSGDGNDSARCKANAHAVAVKARAAAVKARALALEADKTASEEAAAVRAALVAPDGSWPNDGAISFVDVKMGYRDGPDVLNGVSFTVDAKEKIGVVGRTGSGKSSLMVALFRFCGLRQGKIQIDGIDISKVRLARLRGLLCIIPQDPVMFSSTLRFNLDPFHEYKDDDLWTVLRKVSLFEFVSTLPNKLEEVVAEGGENLSVGQRQLVCIARALLRRPKILVMDEATASIDNETDALIQTMVREEFKHATVLTIAHRLNTIMDSDRVLVLDSGNVIEYDKPENLLNKSGGTFRGMVEAAENENARGVAAE